jgi:membrane protease YdiL (CAAX protease family)
MWPLALIFGLLHWPQGAWGVFGVTLVALALSGLFLASNSLWVVLAAHYVLNLGQLILARRLGLRPLRGALHGFSATALPTWPTGRPGSGR